LGGVDPGAQPVRGARGLLQAWQVRVVDAAVGVVAAVGEGAEDAERQHDVGVEEDPEDRHGLRCGEVAADVRRGELEGLSGQGEVGGGDVRAVPEVPLESAVRVYGSGVYGQEL